MILCYLETAQDEDYFPYRRLTSSPLRELPLETAKEVVEFLIELYPELKNEAV